MAEHSNRRIALRLWQAIAESDVSTLSELVSDKAVWIMYGRSPLAGAYKGLESILGFRARVGELSDELSADLLDVFVSERGAVIRYAVHALRGRRRLEIEQLLMIRIERGVIVEGVFSPIDQERYDRFWQDA